ncbi:MAG TPA: DUF932 domain-containing protein [Planctomycetota bacterium]|nr:DUF932 domain-containing protein [Planctomycetota bacterium]
MAHEISFNNAGQAEAMFAGTKPWHGLGTMVKEMQRPLEALKLARLDWTVMKTPLYLGNGEEIADKVAIVREDSGAYLGTVGTGYTPVQNHEQAEFIEALLGTGEATVECAGVLRGGRRTFWTCKLADNLKVTDGDVVEKYLILCNGHDGTLAFRAFWSPIRVVCQNTLNAALDGVKDGVVFYHFLNVNKRIDEARNILRISNSYYDALCTSFRELQATRLSDKRLREYLETVFPVSEESKGKPAETIVQKTRNQVRANFYEGRGADVAGKTAWGAYNAVTEYVCHQKKQLAMDSSSAGDRRFEQIFFGTGKELQQRAFNTALALANA